MELNIPGLVGGVCFSLVCIVISIWSTRKKRIADRYSSTPQDESFLIAGRDIGWLVGSCSLTGTILLSLTLFSNYRSIRNIVRHPFSKLHYFCNPSFISSCCIETGLVLSFPFFFLFDMDILPDVGWTLVITNHSNLFSFSFSATFVTSIFVNSTTRSIYKESLANTHFPWGLSLSVLAGNFIHSIIFYFLMLTKD